MTLVKSQSDAPFGIKRKPPNESELQRNYLGYLLLGAEIRNRICGMDFDDTLHSVTTHMTQISSFVRSQMSAIMDGKACGSKLLFYCR